MASGDVVYRIDAKDRIVFVNPEWDRFALENGGAPLVSANVVGRSLWSFLTDPTAEEVGRLLLDAARGGRVFHLDFRCDAPDRVRRQRLHLTRLGDEVELRTETLSTFPRSVVDLSSIAGGGAPVRICSWCKRVEHEGEWLDIEIAASRRELLDGSSMLTHGMCADCERQLDDAVEPA